MNMKISNHVFFKFHSFTQWVLEGSVNVLHKESMSPLDATTVYKLCSSEEII